MHPGQRLRPGTSQSRGLDRVRSPARLFATVQKLPTVSQKKQDTKLLPITSPNVNRFSKFFHWQTHW